LCGNVWWVGYMTDLQKLRGGNRHLQDQGIDGKMFLNTECNVFQDMD